MGIFTKLNLRLSVSALSLFRMVTSLYVFVFGIIIANNLHVSEVFGSKFRSLGGGLGFVAFMTILNTPVGQYASKWQNKFLLSVHACADALLAPLQFIIALVMVESIKPKFAASFQKNCLTNNLPGFDYNTCEAFYKDDRTAGWKLLWMAYFEQAAKDVTSIYFQKIVTIQSNGNCCGFGRPFQCVEDSRAFPSSLYTKPVGAKWRTQRVLCGPQLNFYPNTTQCSSVVNPTALHKVVGGCWYDYTLGACSNQPITPYSLGCQAALEQYVTPWIKLQSYLVLGLILIQAMSIFVTCCICWKKRDDDVLPGYMQEGNYVDPYLQINNSVLIGSKIKVSTFRPQIASALQPKQS